MKRKIFTVLISGLILGCASSKKIIIPEKESKTEDKSLGKEYRYEYTLVRPVKKDKLSFADKNISIDFVIDASFIHIRLKNRTRDRIKVRLFESQIFSGTKSSPVVSFNYINRFKYSPVSVSNNEIIIMPNTYIILHLAPASNIIETNGEFEVISFYPTVDWNDEEKLKEIKSNIGKRIGLYLPIEIGDRIYDYYFEFKITGVKEIGPYRPRRKPAVGAPQTLIVQTQTTGPGPEESFIASTLIAFFVLISAYFLFAKEKSKI